MSQLPARDGGGSTRGSRGRSGGGGGGRGGGHHSRGGRGSHHGHFNKRPVNNLLSQTSSHSHTYAYAGQQKPPSSSALPTSTPSKRLRSDLPPSSRPLTVSDLLSDTLTPLANAYWAPGQAEHAPYDPGLIQRIYASHLASPSSPSSSASSLTVLELSAYLENYLWKHFSPSASAEHVLSIVFLVNEKFRAALPAAFDALTPSPLFPVLFARVLGLKRQRDLSVHEATEYLLFFIHLFSSLEQPVVRKHALRLLSLPLWRSLSAVRRERELRGRPELRTLWEKVVRQCEEGKGREDKDGVPSLDTTSSFMPRLLSEFVSVLVALPSSPPSDDAEYDAKVVYCERFVELCIDLLSQLPTRRFFHALLSDCQLIAVCRLSALCSAASSTSPLFSKMVDLMQAYDDFDIDDHTGEPIAADAVLSLYHHRIAHMQRVVFREFEQLRPLALVNVAALDSREGLERWLGACTQQELRRLCERLRLRDGEDVEKDEVEQAVRHGTVTSAQIAALLPPSLSHAYFFSVLCTHHLSHRPQQQLIDTLPLYPTETLLFDHELLPPSSSHYSALHPLPLPKLNLQFLSLSDYLLRNFTLFRLEASYQIREDLAYTVSRLRPRLSNDGAETLFTGWSRMAVPVARFAVAAVKPARLGETVPREVRAEVERGAEAVYTGPGARRVGGAEGVRRAVPPHRPRSPHPVSDMSPRAEREQASGRRTMAGTQRRRGDYGRAPSAVEAVWAATMRRAAGAARRRRATSSFTCVAVRCTKVVDESGPRHRRARRGRPTASRHRQPAAPTASYLDPAQYAPGHAARAGAARRGSREDVYTTFNLLVRRQRQGEQLQGRLSSIRDMLQAKRRDVELPPFLRSVFLGYGDVEASQYWRQKEERRAWTRSSTPSSTRRTSGTASTGRCDWWKDGRGGGERRSRTRRRRVLQRDVRAPSDYRRRRQHHRRADVCRRSRASADAPVQVAASLPVRSRLRRPTASPSPCTAAARPRRRCGA